MGRHKNEMRKIHRKKLKKAREKIKLYEQNKLTYDQLPKLAKRILEKRQRYLKSQEVIKTS